MPTFKCSRCGHRSHSFSAMSKHARTHKFARKSNPGRRRYESMEAHMGQKPVGHYCPVCGVLH